MKKILITLLILLSSIVYSQNKIGTINLKDSSGVLVIQAPIKTNISDGTKVQWVLPKNLSSSVAGLGLSLSTTNGLIVNVGDGLTIIDDTLRITETLDYTDSLTILRSGVIPFIRFNNEIDNSAKIKINENVILTFDFDNDKTNVATNLTSNGDMLSGRDVYALSNFLIGDANSSNVVIDDSRNMYPNELHINDVNQAFILVNDILVGNGFDGSGYTPSGENYFGGAGAVMTDPSRWLPIDVDGTTFLIPLYQ